MTAPPSLEPPTYSPPPPPPGPPARPPLRRSGTDKVIGGVSGGLAEYTGIDALLWRVGFVALAFAGGTGVLVYLLLWLLMPVVPGGAGSALAAGLAARRSAPAGPRSPVPGLTVAALFIVVGVLALLARLTSWEPDGRVFLSAALLVVGLGLVAAGFTGGRTAKGGLITLGIILSLAVMASLNSPWDGVRGGVGDRTWVPADADSVRPVYRGGVGDVELDLSGIDVGDLDGPVRTRLDAGVGDVDVLLPQDADVQVEVSNGLGDVDVLGAESSDGGLYPGTGPGSWVDDGDPEIVLTIDAGVGNVEVQRG
jgi:phage shock protein PspC (stress-responsive transcriptional regulator)